ncbi:MULTISPECIES: pilus assembly protein TadG-related protein [unclassified Nocardioides]|uniref:pilus assembly protein TadG-related protein n=1 Tax=unclassified Nocardioides TaxID=2615069 RepID=UPI00361E6693
MLRNRERDERGATALLAALLALVMFGLGAVVVDVGQAWAKRSLLQTSVDLAVMAAAAELTSDGACNPEVVDKATEFLVTKTENTVAGQYPIDLGGGQDDGDGWIHCEGWKVTLQAPASRVDYTLAEAVSDDDHVDVAAQASAQIMSPGQSASLPMYAVAGCDTGHQQLSDPPPGPPPAVTPPALVPDGTAQIRNLVVTPSEAPAGSVAPFAVTVTGQVKGGIAAGATGQVTFNDAAGGASIPAGTPVTLPTGGGGWNDFTINLPTVPQAVLDANGISWVRVKVVTGATTDFSPTAEAEPFTVGDLLFCGGMVSGNFGTLEIARSSGSPSTWLEMNMIDGIEPALQINASNAVPCSPVDSDHTPTSPTDCLGTDPGFPNEAATDGLVNGSGGRPGRLDHDTTPGCDRTGGSSRTNTAPALNDDVLSCFITGGHSIGDVVAGVPQILSADILRSPRFFMLPVIPVQAANGASGAYPIVDFRPGFITEESLAATSGSPGAVTGHNGVHFHSNHVEELNVVLFDEAALPETAPAVGGEVEYTGSGTKVIVLVD